MYVCVCVVSEYGDVFILHCFNITDRKTFDCRHAYCPAGGAKNATRYSFGMELKENLISQTNSLNWFMTGLSSSGIKMLFKIFFIVSNITYIFLILVPG